MAKKKVAPNTNDKELSEKKIAEQVFDEYSVARRNQEGDDAEFESLIDILECQRNERDYEWMSDVFVPEFASIFLTESAQWANMDFASRDFVEVYLSATGQMDIIKAKLVKHYINTALNQKEVYHFPKRLRLKGINALRGACYALCRWERVQKDEWEESVQPDGTTVSTVRTSIQVDRFNYDPLDPRNIVMSNEYVYSLQDKRYIIVRDEVTWEQLKDKEKARGYINLDVVKKLTAPEKTETAKETYQKFEEGREPAKPVLRYFDHLIRFGKMWAVVGESDPETGNPITATPGLDSLGNVKKGAELIEAILEVVFVGSQQVLIRFQPSPFISSLGKPYRPIIRGLCYIHPVKDVGMSDGKYSRELQVAINDTINMSNDRVKLATLPTFKGQQNAISGNDQIYFEPEHVIPLPNVADLEELEIKDDIRGALAQANLFIAKMQQVNSIYPTTMGELPGMASTTATAIAGAESRTNLRANYKALTFEYTFDQEFYWMMLQMAYQFMHPQTALKLWGPAARYFDPEGEYSFTPVSSNVEQEFQKDRKVQRYDQIASRIATVPNPAIIPILAFIIARQCELLGSEYQTIAPLVEALARTPNTPEVPQGGQTAPSGQRLLPTSNQSGQPMSLQEQAARSRMGGM